MSVLHPKHWDDAKWPTAVAAGIMGIVSLGLLVLTVPRMFSDYVLFPLVKEAYILPEWRYRLFDAVLLAWCIDGLIASILQFRNTSARPILLIWARRTMLLYFVGLAILISGVVVGIWLRSHGI